MPAPIEIRKLVERFEANLDSYRNGAYNETLLRRDFLDPLFKALGWDIDNSHGYAEAFREVVHEDAIKIGGATKAPDYSFRIGGRRIFFLEAKKPSVLIKEDIAPAYQLRRYAWSANLPLSVLSDFEEFAVYDCRIKPVLGDKAAKGRVLYFTFRDYLDRWDEIAGIFSKDAVLKGSFDRYANAAKGKRGTTGVDGDFLAQIEGWRETLAKNIALRNPGIEVRDLNFAVQTTIDRIVFLRICEDRGIEPLNRLQGLTNGTGIYARLTHVFHEADDRYNSGLFHFKAEKERAGNPDEFTLSLKIDDKVLKALILSLYYPESPYEFSVLPADILGQVYERFLGKVIRLTAGGQAKVEEKPEVKKAGGVYYTPTYIVDYIVKQTIGRLCDGKSPKDVAKLRILDPACGSGSFLIGAYQYLLDWHLAWYAANEPEKHAKGKETKVYRSGNGWRLTAAERKRVLTNNIFGVDIDAQAVEVSKLSLLLKVLEGETDETLNAQMKLFHERALPDLDGNIKCGNSLIGYDFFDGRLDLDNDAHRRINPFDWRREFPEAFIVGGFDAVIGNPPYVRPHNIPEETKSYLWKTSKTFVAKSDLYSCFMERALEITKVGGFQSFIVPKTWTSLESFTNTRGNLLDEALIRRLIQLPKKVFKDATVETCIYVAERNHDSAAKRENQIEVEFLDGRSTSRVVRRFSQSSIYKEHLCNFQLYGTNDNEPLFVHIRQVSSPLGEQVLFAYGFKTADDAQFVHTEKRFKESQAFIRSGALRRYWHEAPYEYVWYRPDLMIKNRSTARPGEAARFEAKKIVVARMGKTLAATFDDTGLYVKDAMILLARPGDDTSLLYYLALINSALLGYYYQHLFITIDVLKNALLNLPIRPINFTEKSDHVRHDRIVVLVEQMLKLHGDLTTAKATHDKTLLERQIVATDRQIDALVYELYGLSDEEITIVEGTG